MSATPTQSAWLIPLQDGANAGAAPSIEAMELKPVAEGLVLGRHEECALRVPVDVNAVSRRHARFARREGVWEIVDLNSRWGTFVNGIKLPPGREAPLADGDLIRIAPWTFLFRVGGPHRPGMPTADDMTTQGTRVRSISTRSPEAMHGQMLNLLLESATAIHAAIDEAALANVLLDAALRGAGLANAALLRPMDTKGNVAVVAQRSARAGAVGEFRFSRSLIAAAANGGVAEISSDEPANLSQSMVQSRVASAICAPLMIGNAVAALLYLYSRTDDPGTSRARPNAAGFCHALAQIAGLALANLKRLEIERRWARLETELGSMSAAQRWLLPREPAKAGALVAWGQCRPGEQVSGDFFDVFLLPDGRLAITLGDVSGHGIGASVLMVASQSFLHAAICHHGDIARAVDELNSYMHTRRQENQFVTLWAGVFDPAEMSLSYVDAGHGYAMLMDGNGEFTPLTAGDAMPVGIAPESAGPAAKIKLPPGGRVVVVSDGIIEQFQSDPAPGTDRERFGATRLRAAIAASPPQGDAVQALLDAVRDFAKTDQLADDATAVMVSWGV